MIGQDKSKDLKSLENLIKIPFISGYWGKVYYGLLRRHYPYEFLQLMRKYRNYDKPLKGRKDDTFFIEIASEAIFWHIKKLNFYFIHSPKTDEEQKEFERISKILGDYLMQLEKGN